MNYIGKVALVLCLLSFFADCLYVPEGSGGSFVGESDLFIDYSIHSFVTEGRNFPVEHMDQYPYYKGIRKAFEEKIAFVNEGSRKNEKIFVEVRILSEIGKPPGSWVQASMLTFYMIPLWLTHTIEVRYAVKEGEKRKEFIYKMNYDVVYSLLFAPVSLVGSFIERYGNYPASRIADSVDLFLCDYEKNRKESVEAN